MHLEKRSIEDEILELNNKLDALLGLYVPYYIVRTLKPRSWVVGYLSDCGLDVEYIARVTGLKEEDVRKEKLQDKEDKSRPKSRWDILKEK
jgi:hypothetical protein